MKLVALFGYYLRWHYTVAFLDIAGVFRNILWFLYSFFSIPVLFVTLFDPFERIHESYGRGFNLQSIVESLVFNIIMRIIGFIMRFSVMVAGVFVLLGTVLFEILFFFVWIALPALIALAIWVGLTFI